MYIWNKQTATGAILDRRHINYYFLIKEPKGVGLVKETLLAVSRVRNHVLKAWKFCNPRAGIRVLAITSQD